MAFKFDGSLWIDQVSLRMNRVQHQNTSPTGLPVDPRLARTQMLWLRAELEGLTADRPFELVHAMNMVLRTASRPIQSQSCGL